MAIGMMTSRPKKSTVIIMTAKIAVATALNRGISSSEERTPERLPDHKPLSLPHELLQ